MTLECVVGGVKRVRMTRVGMSALPRRARAVSLPLSSESFSRSDRHRSAHCIAGRLAQPLLLPRHRLRCPEPEQAWLKQLQRME